MCLNDDSGQMVCFDSIDDDCLRLDRVGCDGVDGKQKSQNKTNSEEVDGF